MEDSSVQEIKDKLSINDVVGGYVQLQRAGRNFRARCPFHKERTPSFMVSPERGTYVCFGCGEKGDIFSFVQRIESVDFYTALKQLAEKAGVVLKHNFIPTPEHKEKDARLYEACEIATVFFESKLKEKSDALEYLHKRGMIDETISSWRLGYAPASWRDVSKHLALHGFSKDEIADAGLAAKSEKKPGEIYDRFRGRIIFPLFDAGGRVIAFSGRFFENIAGAKEGEEPAKYVNSPETALFKKSRVLYGYDRAKNNIRKVDCILMVEGQFDVVLSHQSGLSYAVAISGTALTQEHLSLLGRLSKRLILALDGDSAGIRAGIRSTAMAYSAGFDVKVPRFPDGKDPADIALESPEKLKAVMRTSQTAIEFFLDALRPSARDNLMYKKMVEVQILPLIAVLTSKIEQAHFIRIVAERLRVSEDAVRAEVAKRPAILQNSTPFEEDISYNSWTVPTLSRLEHSSRLIFFHFETDTIVQEKLRALVGEQRYMRLQEVGAHDKERFRFEFEALNEDEVITQEKLFDDIERIIIKEEIVVLRNALYSADTTQEAELMKKLNILKRREQEPLR